MAKLIRVCFVGQYTIVNEYEKEISGFCSHGKYAVIRKGNSHIQYLVTNYRADALAKARAVDYALAH